MLNGLIMRTVLLVIVLWLLLIGGAYAGASFWLWLYLFAVIGLFPAALLLGAALSIRWILGPIGRWGA